MALEVGSRLGHYDVTAKIGEGGMGEVYRARDTKLDRDVALKGTRAPAEVAMRVNQGLPQTSRRGYTLFPVTSFRDRILTHWREFRPTLVNDLERSGELDAVVTSLEQTLREKQADVIRRGMSPAQAEQALQPMWMISDEDGVG